MPLYNPATAASSSGGLETVLYDSTLGSAGTFDVSNISGAYDDLIVRLYCRSAQSTVDWLNFRFNNDSGNNYDLWSWSSASGGASADTSQAQLGGGSGNPTFCNPPVSDSPAGSIAVVTLTIFGYSQTTFRKVTEHRVTMSSFDSGDTQRYYYGSGEWRSTSAINRVAAYLGSGNNFVTGSRMTIIGRKFT